MYNSVYICIYGYIFTKQYIYSDNIYIYIYIHIIHYLENGIIDSCFNYVQGASGFGVLILDTVDADRFV